MKKGKINMEATKKSNSFKDLVILIMAFILFALVYVETRGFYF
ncbi:hypothetical protein [Dyadobacter sp. NIV53]|nr:hypothetical protein [Dyadobacter sp. NIV53]